MTLYWGGTLNPQEKKIGEFKDGKSLRAAMMKHIKELGFKSYYQRWTDGEPLWCDYGSHYKFYWVFDGEILRKELFDGGN